MAKQKPTKMLAVLGRSQRTGRWRLASRSSVLALLGSCNLDMRASFVEDDKLKMKVTVLLGSATFTLPDGAEVRPSGMSLLSSSTVDIVEQDEDAELPMLEIEWTAILGRLRIITHRSDETDSAESAQSAAAPTGTADHGGASTVAAAPAPAAVGFEDLQPAPAVGFEDLAPAEPPPAIGFEDLGDSAAPPAAVGFEDLGDSAAPPPSIGFEDLGDDSAAPAAPPPSIGFEDLGDDSAAPAAPPSIGFEDLGDDSAAPAAPAAVGFEDL